MRLPKLDDGASQSALVRGGFVLCSLMMLLESVGCYGGGGEACAIMGRDLALRNGQPASTSGLASIAAGTAQVRIGNHSLCTAFLIAPRWLLSAEHCIGKQIDPSMLSVYFGPGPFGGAPELVRTVERAHDSDLVLIELEGEQRERLPVAIARSPLRLDAGMEVVLAGVGWTGDRYPDEVLFVTEEVLEATPRHVRVTGFGVSGACGGDSGGPLLVREGDGFVAVGVLSRGSEHCLGIDEYTTVAGKLAWIDSRLRPDECGR